MFTEREFTQIPETDREILRNAIAEAIGEPDARKIGDGKLLEALSKLFALFLQFAPLFMEPAEAERKIGDGTIFAAFLAMLSNPDFIKNIAALFALFTK
jgi:hypothetical protein